MALLSFPSNPSDNDLYPNVPVVGQSQYRWSAVNQTWILEGIATGVTPGCYGSATSVPAICVDAQGRLTVAADVPISATIPDLQIVTDQGAVSTNVIDVAGLVAAGLAYPSADGAGGDVLITDGAGNLSFAAPTVEDLDTVTTAGNTTANTINVGGLVAAGLTYPSTDGVANDVLVTDGVGNLSFVTPPVEDLDTVTTAGNTTANSIDVGGLIAAGLTYPSTDGLANDVLVTDGAGNLSFATPPVEDLDTVTTAGNTTANTIDVGGLVAAGLNYPLADGAADQVLTTDGAGTLGWSSTVRVVAAPSTQTDLGAAGEVAYDAGYWYWHDGANWQRVAAEAPGW